MSALPRLGKKLPAGAGWAVQSFHIPSEEDPWQDTPAYQRGYVKIFKPSGECTDTALTIASARRRVKLYKGLEK